MLVSPTFVFENVYLLGVSAAWTTPVPDRVTLCGPLRALSVKVSVPVCGPNAVGVKVTLTLHDWPAASAAPVQEFAEIAQFPLIATLLKVSRSVPLLVNVTVLAAPISLRA